MDASRLKIETDTRYRWRGMRFRVAFFALSLALFIAVCLESYGTGRLLHLWSILFALSVVVGLLFEHRLKRRYHCPRCGLRLSPPAVLAFDGSDEYVHDCARCSIRWRTMTHPPEPSA
jgi:hypothetical protein